METLTLSKGTFLTALRFATDQELSQLFKMVEDGRIVLVD